MVIAYDSSVKIDDKKCSNCKHRLGTEENEFALCGYHSQKGLPFYPADVFVLCDDTCDYFEFIDNGE